MSVIVNPTTRFWSNLDPKNNKKNPAIFTFHRFKKKIQNLFVWTKSITDTEVSKSIDFCALVNQCILCSGIGNVIVRKSFISGLLEPRGSIAPPPDFDRLVDTLPTRGKGYAPTPPLPEFETFLRPLLCIKKILYHLID